MERQVKDADPQMLADARLAIRAEEEQKVISDLEQGYGHAYDPNVMRAAKDNISKLLEDKEAASEFFAHVFPEKGEIADRLNKLLSKMEADEKAADVVVE